LRLVRFVVHGWVEYGLLEDEAIYALEDSPFAHSGRITPKGLVYRLDDVKLLPPCLPSKIVCLGLNYRSHAEELKMPPPSVPFIFFKPPTAVIGPDEPILLPSSSKRVDYEGELAVVIGKKAKDVPEDKAREYVLGYTCFNDVTERHLQQEKGEWTRAKSYDTFAPLGPWIETEVSPDDLKLETYLNGELRQSARTSDLIFGIPELISFISSIMTLLPGDIIATGTPSGIGPLAPGDVVEVKIEKIGSLRNFVVGQE